MGRSVGVVCFDCRVRMVSLAMIAIGDGHRWDDVSSFLPLSSTPITPPTSIGNDGQVGRGALQEE